MEYGIQRRGIYLVPPGKDDLDYLFETFQQQEVWESFGFDGPSQKLMKKRHQAGDLIIGIIKKVEGRKRIGFGVTFPPPALLIQWEYGLVIQDPAERNAFNGISASDAMTHYLFDHLRLTDAMWRCKKGNPSNALARRMGYRPFGVFDVHGSQFSFYRMTQEIWAKRRDKLLAGEEKRPSGIGAAFLTLMNPPYEPEEA